MKKREIRPLVPEDMNRYIDIYLNAYPAGKDLSEECKAKFYNRNMQSLREFDHVNFFGMFEDDTLIAIMKLIDFDMNLFGEMKRATGLMSLGVHPLHKRKGAARDMVEFFEKYTTKSGGVVSMLLPFRMDFYKKLGYSCGTKLEEYHIKTEYLPDCSDRSELAGLRFLTGDEVELAVKCYTEFVRQNHGAVCKFEEEIRDMHSDDDVRRLGLFHDGELKGYAAFTFENTSDCNYTLNRLNVKELVYLDAETLRKLLAGLRMQSDLVQSVVIRSGEPDFHYLLESCQDMSGNYIDFGFLQTNIAAVGTMYKICDIEKFIKESAHRCFPDMTMNAGFNVEDDLKGTEERFALNFEGGYWSYAPGESAYDSAQVHVSCKRSDLSALLMGSAEFAGLARTGSMKVDKQEFVKRLDMLFHAEQKPFTNTDY
ncbi:MAG: GNAT family N-acetyltransferase [Firmicutes bacterium]|nr:GNAT family N-acetyltransferase [Bacillota bacterium]